MTQYGPYKKIAVTIAEGGATVLIDNQDCEWGMNIFTPDLNDEINDFSIKVETDDRVRAVVLRSADPDFFIAHYDVSVLVKRSAKHKPSDPPPSRPTEVSTSDPCDVLTFLADKGLPCDVRTVSNDA